jgi:hypothetical protein
MARRLFPKVSALAAPDGSSADGSGATGFLFAIAAALIIGESYRGSRSNKKQRDRTEDAVEELRDAVELLGERMGVARSELWREGTRDEEEEGTDKGEQAAAGEGSSSAQQDHFEPEPSEAAPPRPAQRSSRASRGERSIAEIEHDRERLQHAVAVLLRLALRSGWVEGPEALRLGQILDGDDAAVAAGSKRVSVPVVTPPRPPSPTAEAEKTPAEAKEEPRTRASIMDEVARARAKAIVDEVRRAQGSEAGTPAGPSLAQLLERAGLDREEAQHVERPPTS